MPHLPDHQTDHDPLLIAAYAAGDASGADLERAQALVAACDACAALHHDLRAIAAALPAIPARGRPRDFRLTPGDAARLRPAGWRRLLAPLAGPRFAFAAPLGGTLAALGLAGVLVAGAASLPIAGQGAARDGTATAGGAAVAASAAQGVEALTGLASAQPSSGDAFLAAPVPVAASPAAGQAAPDAGVGGAAGTGPAASADAGKAGDSGESGGSGASANRDVPPAPPQAGPVDQAATVASPSSGLPAAVPIASAALLLVGLGLLGLAVARRRLGGAAG